MLAEIGGILRRGFGLRSLHGRQDGGGTSPAGSSELVPLPSPNLPNQTSTTKIIDVFSFPSSTTSTATSSTVIAHSTPTAPLTTVFTPAPSCSSAVDVNGNVYIAPTDSKDCYPFGWASTIYYSPGVCPHGYYTASKSLHNDSSKLTETVGICCPNSFTYRPSSSACYSNINSGVASDGRNITPTTITTLVTTIPDISSNEFITVGTDFSYSQHNYHSVDTVISTNSLEFTAASIQIRWQQTDTQVICLMDPKDPACQKKTSATSATSPPTGGTGGWKAGVGVGIPLLVFAMLIGAWFLWRRHQNRLRNLPSDHEAGQRALPEAARPSPGFLAFWNRPNKAGIATTNNRVQALNPSSGLEVDEKPKSAAYASISELDSKGGLPSELATDKISSSVPTSELDGSSTLASHVQPQQTHRTVESGYSPTHTSPIPPPPPVPVASVPVPITIAATNGSSVSQASDTNRRYSVPRKEVSSSVPKNLLTPDFATGSPTTPNATSSAGPLPLFSTTSPSHSAPTPRTEAQPPTQTASSPRQSLTHSISSIPMEGDSSSADLAALKERVAKIRQERDRISRLQELSEEEDRLKRLIAEHEEASSGS